MTRVVAFGGGRGLSAALRALTRLDVDLTAVVTVADDGGSTGDIRATRPVLPPGDLRKALVATADPAKSETARLFSHRFGGEDFLTGHPVGNVVLTGLLELHADPVVALDFAARLLGSRARVLPMSCTPLDIEADLEEGPGTRTIVGQHDVAVADGSVKDVRLLPADATACPETLEAVAEADWHVFGPGSWYTSVIPHLLLPDLREAIGASKARRIVVLNLSEEKETDGLTLAGHVDTLRRYAEGVRFHYVVSGDTRTLADPGSLNSAAQSLEAQLVAADLASDGVTHDVAALAAVLGNLLVEDGG
ncbi:uridine diphosphate-N-acetylglucosamine-binding protein YvcK [Glycomyces luteolus]|uniref:Uridine diphosphate-N-acetylglucosamine-binding protein YvcK n=1 Tax=Glycomyces luteolus TaxID=2670330 RepID=A0A9X3SPZ1_9ACTN|nr:uridine diphosphate-N-acetylglucosamine-binding protein YvcK [Glycomyces luteolus]MDA1359952.1 uridine diphosphate-N-acetylglucosamine-binding protein YvcK [Glycomyces luteolus]